MDDCTSSIVFSLQAVACEAGYEIDGNDLCAVLGISWMAPAVPFEKDLGCWPMYARDAFLVEGARLFGMAVRSVHPPQAARGLERLPEFRQHFDASYRPLILNALANNQAVLAWRGWPGEYELCWGVITGACDGGVGFEGMIRRWVNDPPYPSPVILESPPVQLHVVETISPTQPEPGEVLNVALTQARCVLNNGLEERFGVLTGSPAYDAWIGRWCEAAPAGGPPSPDLIRGHQRLVAATVSAHSSAIRFLERHEPQADAPVRTVIEAMTEACHAVVTSLESCGGHGPLHGVSGGQCPPYGVSGGQYPRYGVAGGQSPPYGVSGGQCPPYGVSGGQCPRYGVAGGQYPRYGVAGGQPPPYGVSGGQCPPYITGGRASPPEHTDHPMVDDISVITDAIARAREATEQMRDALQGL